jgi:hypothetical protein
MATDKKSFILYADLIDNIDHLTNEEKGILFTHLLDYVNDRNPVLEDRLILTAWKPIERQLKRDLKKFEQIKSKRSDAGKKSAELRALKKEEQDSTNPTSVKSVQHRSTNPTVNVNVNENVNDINIIYSEIDFLENWKMCRKKFMTLPTHIKKLETFERIDFNNALKDFSKDEMNTAMLGLFNQEVKNITSMYLKPKHFLENISKYLNAEMSKDYGLYGKKIKQVKGAL